jgi:site-specific recombinase XerD
MASDAKRLLDGAWAGVAAHRLVHCEPRDRGFLALRNLVALELLFATGMRVGELVSLRLKDWREDDQSFVVQGKGDRQRLAILPDDRSVAAVQAYLPKRRALQVGQDALLLNAAGRPLSTQGVARVLDRFAHQAGVPTHVTPHMIRHTVATLLLRHGADIRVVQEVLGHTSITTTQRYTHVSKEHLMETLRAHHPSRHMSVTTSALGIPA